MRIFNYAISVLTLFNSLSLVLATQQKPLLEHNAPLQSLRQWDLNFSSPAPHYFSSVYGLLQQWPNTFFPNGHSIAPCEIPRLTRLYHGRMDGEVPPSPEWVAFDIGMAYGIMGGTRNSHMLTYQTTRRAKCLYFDGESATLFGIGQLDTQMLHLYGNVTGPPRPSEGRFRGLWEEYNRASGLCKWLQDEQLGGLGWGYEGIVRMNAGFEMIWCNFSSPSIRLISHLNVTAPILPCHDTNERLQAQTTDQNATSYYPLPPSPTRTDKAIDPSNPPIPPIGRRPIWLVEPFVPSQAWNWFASAASHYGSSGEGPRQGETRVKINACGFLSYYSPVYSNRGQSRSKSEQEMLNLTDTGLWKGPGNNGNRSHALQTLMRRRRIHNLHDITPSEAAVMKSDSERVLRNLLTSPETNCSGIDWNVMANDIVQSYAIPLAGFQKTIVMFEKVSSGNATSIRSWWDAIRDHTHTFLLPFLEYPNDNPNPVWSRESRLFQETYSRCKFQYTRLLDPDMGIELSPEEQELKLAVEEVSGGICSVLVDIGLSIEEFWQAKYDDTSELPTSLTLVSLETEIARWARGVEELMAWLGWAGEWVGCDEKCALDEKCFIPMWPMIPLRKQNRGRPHLPPGYRPGYGIPGYGHPYSYYRIPGNRTGGRDSGWWFPDEAHLWNPICVKSDYLYRIHEDKTD